MKTIVITLPDGAVNAAMVRAKRMNIDISSLCSTLLVEHFEKNISSQENDIIFRENNESSSQLNMSALFPNFPHQSIRFAQIVVDEVLKKYPAVKLSRKKNGISFTPNFIYIESLFLRKKTGIKISFYGIPEKFKSPPKILKYGWGSYSRAEVVSEDDLRDILPLIKQAYELKFGKP